MSEAKKPKGGPDWIAAPHDLSPEAKAEIIDALGYAKSPQDPGLIRCLDKIEGLLAGYPGAVEAFDNAPSVTVYQRELRALIASAEQIIKLLNDPEDGINAWTRMHLNRYFYGMIFPEGMDPIATITDSANNLRRASERALEAHELKEKRGKGRRPALARGLILEKLLELFGGYTRRRPGKRNTKGAIGPLTAFERQEIRFVRAAFSDIKVDRFGEGESGDKKWLALIRDARLRSAALGANLTGAARTKISDRILKARDKEIAAPAPILSSRDEGPH
jgi:hypothetical protein